MGLGTLVRQAGTVSLAYPGIESIFTLSNACWPSAHALSDRLGKMISERYATLLTDRKAPPQQRGWGVVSTSHDVSAQDEIKHLKKLKSEIDLDLSRYRLPKNTPVCLYSLPVLRAHESMHALFGSLYPKASAAGEGLREYEYLRRAQYIKLYSIEFLRGLGPYSTALAEAIHKRIPDEKSEEILAGLFGMVALAARRTGYSDERMNEEWAGLVRALSSYMTVGGPPKNLDLLSFYAAQEWKSKLGTGLTPVKRWFQRYPIR